MSQVTILIAARNAAATIERAIRSALAQGPCPIVLVDDFSDDGTAAIARRIGGARLRVISPPRHHTLGLTRQTGLDAVDSKYTMLLDADDELLADRAARMERALDSSGLDVYADALLLNDGETGAEIREVHIPGFLVDSGPVPYRLFERNHLPGIGQIAFRTELARKVGYDIDLHGAEDVDLALRMVMARARFHYDNTPGYRMYAYPASLSRDIANQRRMYRRCLAKFPYQSIRDFYVENGGDGRIALWALVSMATFREDHEAAMAFLDEIAAMPLDDPLAILEPDGPAPYPEAWRIAFQRGTLALLLGRDEAARSALAEALSIMAAPEAHNNLAVALARLGRPADARRHLRQALSRSPAFLDAGLNLSASHPHRITTHPLRRHLSRSEYQASSDA